MMPPGWRASLADGFCLTGGGFWSSRLLRLPRVRRRLFAGKLDAVGGEIRAACVSVLRANVRTCLAVELMAFRNAVRLAPNRTGSRSGTPRPPSQWIAFKVPSIIDEDTFNAAQALLRSRNPKRTPPRVANGPTFLAGLARCGNCGAALIQNTGKGGAYRYYCCTRKLKAELTACRGLRIRMDKLDGIVIGEVAKRILEPQRLTEMLQSYAKAATERETSDRDRLAKLRRDQAEAKAGIEPARSGGEGRDARRRAARAADGPQAPPGGGREGNLGHEEADGHG